MTAIPTAYIEDNALSYAKQTLKVNSVGICAVIRHIRNTWNNMPPEIRNLLARVFAAEWLLRQIDRTGRVLDGGDIIAGIHTL